ncbi:hypothetical protein CQA66_03460 [Helicobacter aurati]|uniref:Outer membrane lipoprotein chaperone LolA n=1 Tax=Helicobacter aurati TaxID=137778 RepID=A0A3D8J663_9HELI|nr:LolA-like outer membrane lipoprotein chaperone [Helicobacter aurati]RDU72948.1 hypothetical protein CQA66_03460 [Helicobacter aurati]
MREILPLHKIIVITLFLCCFALGNDTGWLNIESLKANFRQEIKGERGATPAIYQGRFYAKENKVKWEYIMPLKKEVYLEKDTAFVYEPNLKQVTIGKLKENVDFIHILKMVKKNTKGEYEATIADTKYTLIAKDSKPYLLSYKDNLDNEISITFTDVEINPVIDSQVFLLQPPDDVEYIDAH